jgi:hypothetical protein
MRFIAGSADSTVGIALRDLMRIKNFRSAGKPFGFP